MNCIKCGKAIPDGELFCLQCSLNPTVMELEKTAPPPSYPTPKGTMQTPRPVRPTPPTPAPSRKGTEKRHPRKTAAILSVALVLCLGLLLWREGTLRVEKNRLRAETSELAEREKALTDLNEEIDALKGELEVAKQTAAAKEEALKELEAAFDGSKSTMSQTQYDMAAQKLELERVRSDYAALEAEAAALTQQLAEAEQLLEQSVTDREKAGFMDSHVVFVENNNTGYYHTYDCENFPKNSFWAYSRKLAESNSYKPCPVCKGKAQ